MQGHARAFTRAATTLVNRCVDVSEANLWPTSIALNHNTVSASHQDIYNVGESLLLLMGDFTDGEFVYDKQVVSDRGCSCNWTALCRMAASHLQETGGLSSSSGAGSWRCATRATSTPAAS